jgi:hypothetical protein
VEQNGLASEGLDKNLHTTEIREDEERDEGWPGFFLDVVVKESAKTKNEMKGGFLLDVVVKESAKTENKDSFWML